MECLFSGGDVNQQQQRSSGALEISVDPVNSAASLSRGMFRTTEATAEQQMQV